MTPIKILMVSNLYPPYTIGGYEMRCSWVAQALQQRGYDVCVVTSSYGCGEPRKEPEFVDGIKVYRCLHDYLFAPIAMNNQLPLYRRIKRLMNPEGIRLTRGQGKSRRISLTISNPYWFFDLPLQPPKGLKQQFTDYLEFIRIVDDSEPDVINWWNLAGLSKGILDIPSKRGIPDVHCVEDVWMRELGTDATGVSLKWDNLWITPWQGKRFRFLSNWVAHQFRQHAVELGIPLRLRNLTSDYACFVSEFQRLINRGVRIHFKDSSVIYGGAFADKFLYHRDWDAMASSLEPLRLLYSGAITEGRRLHIILDALDLMAAKQRRNFKLTVVGKPPIETTVPYFTGLRKRLSHSKIIDMVVFMGHIPFDELPGIYINHDVLVFPSARPEGLPLTMVEAMLSGCCVITAGSGGAGEVALMADLPLFAVDSAPYLRKMLLNLEEDRKWMVECARRGQSVALKEFTFDRMIKEFEIVLKDLIHQ